MNTELRELLIQAGLTEADDPRVWSRAIMVHATGLLPPPPDRIGTSGEAGFHFLLLDEQGRAVHRVKCRWATDKSFERECETLGALCRDPRLNQLVPEIRTAVSSRLRICVSRELPGRSYLFAMRKQDVGEWQRTVEEVLALIDLIGERAQQVVPWLRPSDSELRLDDALADRFDQLEGNVLDAGAIEIIRAKVRDISVPFHPQHGDLWPDNLLRDSDGRWCVIDFETFGQIRFPLYDAFHLAWSSRNRAWPDRDKQAADGEVIMSSARRRGLSDLQVGALRLAFLVEVTAHRMRPGAGGGSPQDLQRQLQESARALAAGLALEDFAPAGRSRTARP